VGTVSGRIGSRGRSALEEGSCYVKQWDGWANQDGIWTNQNYCELKSNCANWELNAGGTWEECCANHCQNTGLTKNKPGRPSPTPGTTEPPTLQPTPGTTEPPTLQPVSLPTDKSIPEPDEKCTATGGACTFPPGAGISAWFTQEMFDEMFPNLCAPGCEDACDMLTYPCLIQATLEYPTFANSGNRDDDMRELAGWLGIMGQETTGGGCQPPGLQNADGTCSCSAPSWCDSQPNGGCSRWGLCKVDEQMPGSTYCDPSSLYPCVPGKSYRGRGPKQLSYNYNYGQFSNDYCGDKSILLQNPEWVATNPNLAWMSSLWFWFTGGACDREGGEVCKPSPHNVFTGKQERSPSDVAANRQYGLGWATNVVNGGLECGGGTDTGKCDYRVYSRVRFYRHFCSILGVEPLAATWTDDNNLFCHNQKNYDESPPEAPDNSPPAAPCSNGCKLWFDGCNTCECDNEGKIGGCTKKYCPEPTLKEPMCQK